MSNQPRTVKELKAYLDTLDQDMDVYFSTFDPHRGRQWYHTISTHVESISRDDLGFAVACKDGEGGNEYALLIT